MKTYKFRTPYNTKLRNCPNQNLENMIFMTAAAKRTNWKTEQAKRLHEAKISQKYLLPNDSRERFYSIPKIYPAQKDLTGKNRRSQMKTICFIQN